MENCFSSSCLSLRFSFPFGKLLYTLTPCCSFIHSGITGTALLYIESATARQADAIQLWNFFLAHRTHLNLYQNSKIQGSSHFLLSPPLCILIFWGHLLWSLRFRKSDFHCIYNEFSPPCLFQNPSCVAFLPFFLERLFATSLVRFWKLLILQMVSRPTCDHFSVFRWFSVWLPENQILLQAIFFAFRSLWGSLNSCSCLALLYSIHFVMSIGFSKKIKKFFVICF